MRRATDKAKWWTGIAAGMTSLLTRELKKVVAKEVLVVMNDGHSYRGILADFDDQWLILQNVSEGTTANIRGFEEPAISMAFVDKVVTFRGVQTREGRPDVHRLKDVLVQVRQVLRIWPLTPENLEKPKHIKTEGAPTKG